MSSVSSRRSRLSNIPENARVDTRLCFTLIGPGAWQLAEQLSRTSFDVFPGLEPCPRRSPLDGGSGGHLGRLNRGLRKPSILRSSDGAPFACKVWLDEERAPASPNTSNPPSPKGAGASPNRCLAPADPLSPNQSHPASSNASSTSATSSEKNRRTFTRGSMVSGLTRSSAVSACSLVRLSMASSCGSQGSNGRRMAAISYFPVEKFADEVPISKSIQRWRHSCLVFLVDTRQEAANPGMPSELQRRQQEVKAWMVCNGRMRGVVPVGHPSRRLYAAVLFHRPPRAWAGGTPLDMLDDDSGGPDTEARYRSLMEGVQELACAPKGESLRHFCNFDDLEEVLRCHVRIALSIVDAPGEELDSLGDTSPRFETELSASEQRHRGCCSLM